VHNTGGKKLRITKASLSIARDGNTICDIPSQNYYEYPTSKTSALFVPYYLKPGDIWAHTTNFLNFFDRETEKQYRKYESELRSDISQKIKNRPKADSNDVIADSALVNPISDLFERMFIWFPGEYVLKLTVNANPGSTTYSKKYRFTLFESDTAELTSHKEGYQFGAGLFYDDSRHLHISLPLTELPD